MILRKLNVFLILLIICCFYSVKLSYPVKIVAIVNESAITDYDVNEFEKILCVFDKRFKCGSPESKQMSLLGLVESTLKLEHFKQIDFGSEKNNIIKSFEEYKKQVLSNIKKKESNVSRSFIDYLYSEYIWNIMVSSQVRKENITKKEIEDFAEKYQINVKNKEDLKNMYIQYKMNEISQQTLAELKKFYLVDVKGL